MMNRTLWLVPALLTLPGLSVAEGTSPWLPIPGETLVSINYTQQEGDDAYIGDDELAASAITGGAASSFERNDTALLINYGISDNLALDALIGYGEVEAGSADRDSGFTDSTIGVSWRVMDEFATVNNVPTITLRGAAIIKGDYEGDRLAALGKAENGFQASALVGKQVGLNWGVSAELGYEYRSGDVPEASFVHLSAQYNPTSALGLSLGYSNKRYGGDLDIGGPGFTPERFQEVNEERELVKFSLNYAVGPSQGIAFTLATLTDGRNTVADDEIAGLTYTHAF